MQIISYFLASIIAYLGLLVGVILIKLAHEEQKPGKKYFIFLKKTIFFLIIAFLLFLYKTNFFLSIILLIFIVILMLNKKLNLEKTVLVYFLFGIILFFSSKIHDLFVIESVLIFLYGIPSASLILKKNNYKEIFVSNLWFFIGVLFYAIP